MRLTPKGWAEFQHYKDRNPPWIRLHKKLLDNFEFHSLPVASKALAPMLWLLASESVDGLIDMPVDKIAFRLRMDSEDVLDALKPLIENGFFECDSAMLAACERSAVPETEAETEALQKPPTVVVASQAKRPACPTEEIVHLYHDQLPMLPRVEVLNEARRTSISARWREVVTDPDIAKAEDVKAAGLEWFAWFFGHCAKSRFLTGRAKDWRADLDFLMTPRKFARAVEGAYHKDAA